MAVTTNLYPPLIETYMPAFLVKDNSENVTKITKQYTITSYAAEDAYENAVDEYITNSEIDGVEELWEEYEAKLAALRAGGITPEEIEQERLLKIEYRGYLEELLQGSSKKTKTEEIFFAEEPSAVVISKSAEFNTVDTTDNKFICRIYFALSPYNSLSQIQNAQITVRSQLTNKTVLHPDKYPCEIMLQNIQLDEHRVSDDKYFIEIRPEDLKDCNFIIDQYYKVQIRFTSSNADDPGIDLSDKDAVQAIDGWLTKNLYNFSEWSTVCLIRGISVPDLVIQDFDPGSATEIYDSVINTLILGELRFADENETETLRSFRIKSYDNSNNLLTDSGEIFANQFSDVNNFYYNIQYWFTVGEFYHFDITYTTQNLYQETISYDFNVIPAPSEGFDFSIAAEKDEENGRVKIHIEKTSASSQTYTGKLIIRRACNKNNYTIWDDMYITNFDQAGIINLDWYDYTVENGIWYRYGVQGMSSNQTRTQMVMIEEPLLLNFEHIFLTSGDRQLKLEFNPSLSSFKRTISEVRTDTIGSKYPFIKRNGYINYVQFPLGGFISSAMDASGTFTSKQEVFGDYLPQYNQYNEDNEIPRWRDVIWEKFFRDKILDFLYADDVKLFRSPTEGNFLIKLMDVQFQPNQTLGRRLWSFSSNAYEIDECNLNNFDKYKVITVYDNSTVISSGGDEPNTLTPIKRIVFIDDNSQFPEEGRKNVLYIYKKEIYIWDVNTNQYILISAPIWNYVDPSTDGLTGVSRRLYTDEVNDLYIWNNNTDEYEKISVPIMEE